MKYYSIILILFFAFSAVSYGQQRKSDTKNDDTAELLRIEQEIGEANIRRDKSYFEKIEADDFIFTDSSGGTTTKTEDVASLNTPAGETKLVSYVVDDARVKLYGKTAVVTGRVTSTYKNKDKEVIIRTRFTDVFVKRNGRWPIVTGHSSRIRE